MRSLRLRVVCVALAAACLAGCFEPPVREKLWLEFLVDGSARVTATVELAGPEAQGGPAVEKRLRELERSLLDGTDAWTGRFAAIAADDLAAERFAWEKRLGRLHEVKRAAWLAAPEDLGRFFGDTDLSVEYRVDAQEGTAELTLQPNQPSRATRKERRQVMTALAEWSGKIAAYETETMALYAYLDQHPGRARACLGAVYHDLLDEAAQKRLPPTTAEEQTQLDRMGEAMQAVWEVLMISNEDERSLDETSRLVFDPFPAELAVTLPAAASEVEGFEVAPDGALAVPAFGLWAAYERLSGRWVSPDPVRLFVAQNGARGEEPLALDVVLAAPRHAAPATAAPNAAAVRQAILEGLAPAPVYRAVWAVRPDEEPDSVWPP